MGRSEGGRPSPTQERLPGELLQGASRSTPPCQIRRYGACSVETPWKAAPLQASTSRAAEPQSPEQARLTSRGQAAAGGTCPGQAEAPVTELWQAPHSSAHCRCGEEKGSLPQPSARQALVTGRAPPRPQSHLKFSAGRATAKVEPWGKRDWPAGTELAERAFVWSAKEKRPPGGSVSSAASAQKSCWVSAAGGGGAAGAPPTSSPSPASRTPMPGACRGAPPHTHTCGEAAVDVAEARVPLRPEEGLRLLQRLAALHARHRLHGGLERGGAQ